MNRSDILDQVLLGQLPNNVFMRGQDFGALPDYDGSLGFDWGGMFSKIGGGFAKAGSFVANKLPSALPKIVDIGSQFAQFKMQRDLMKTQQATDNAYNAAANAANVSIPAGSSYSPTSPNASYPYSQPTSENILTKQVAGIPVWALGAGGVLVLALLLRR